MATPHVAARDAALALRNLRTELIAAAPRESRGDVARLLDEAEHHVACALAAAGVHPRARTVEEPSRVHAPSIAPLAQEGQSE